MAVLTTVPTAGEVVRGGGARAAETLTLDHEGRFLRRRRLVTDGGREILVDLAEAADLDDGDALRLADGSLVAIRAAAEPLLSVRGDLPRLAWHVGNRHAPCMIAGDRLLLRADPVMADMLRRLGADLAEVREPFRPERGAYGTGRTMGHAHPDALGHDALP